MRLLVSIFIVFFFITVTKGQSVRFLVDDYEYALKKAKRENKLVFIDTYASWCKPCKKQEPVFRDRSLAQFFNDHFVNVKVDMDNDLGKSLALKYSVVFLPTLMILDQQGNVRYRSDQSFTADILSAKQLLDIAMHTTYPERPATATVSSPPAKKPQPTIVEAKPKLRHVQHTPLPKDVREEKQVAKSTKVEPSVFQASDIVVEGEEKILYVLGAGDDVPPEVLREEAYFRLSLMDGSHKKAVKKYLSTQKDWSQEENMKFLFDFLYSTRTDEFTYLIINRHKFVSLLGKEKVAKTIEILVNQTLERAIPRPDRKEAQALYSYLDRSNSREKGTKYHLNRLLQQEKIDEFVPLANEYLKDMNPSDIDVMYALSSTLAENTDDKKSLKEAMKLIKKSIKIQGKQFRLLDLKAFLYYKMEDKNKAMETAQVAIALAKSRGINHDSTLELVQLIDNL